MTFSKLLIAIAIISSGLASLLFGILFGLAWRERHLFNAEGRYFDEAEAVVHHDQTLTLIVPAIGFLLLAVLFGLIWRARRDAAR